MVGRTPKNWPKNGHSFRGHWLKFSHFPTWMAPHSHSSTPYHPSISCAAASGQRPAASGPNSEELQLQCDKGGSCVNTCITLQSIYIYIFLLLSSLLLLLLLLLLWSLFLSLSVFVCGCDCIALHYGALYCLTFHYMSLGSIASYYKYVYIYIYNYSYSGIDMCIHSYIDLTLV